jgi:CheY-like chemotaxis protein
LLVTRAISEIDGVKLVLVDTGGDALDYIHRRGPFEQRRPKENPDLVIAGHKLPDMLAIDLVRVLRGHPTMGDLPVFVYASELNGEASLYVDYEVDGPVMKPETDEDFRAAVRDAVRRNLVTS